MYEIILYDTEDGRCPVQELLDSLEPKLLAKTLRTIDLLEFTMYDYSADSSETESFFGFTRSHFMNRVDSHNHTEKRVASKIFVSRVHTHSKLAKIYFLIFFLELFGLVVERYPNQKLFFLSHSPT